MSIKAVNCALIGERIFPIIDQLPDPALEVHDLPGGDSPLYPIFPIADALLLEAQAMVAVGAALEPLPPDAQSRVLKWACGRSNVAFLKERFG